MSVCRWPVAEDVLGLASLPLLLRFSSGHRTDVSDIVPDDPLLIITFLGLVCSIDVNVARMGRVMTPDCFLTKFLPYMLLTLESY
jgi:hypothetical protein